MRHERRVEKATIDLTNRSPVAGIETPAAVDLDAQRAADVARIERGEPLEEMPDIKTQMANVARKAAATEVVIERLEAEFQSEFMKLSAAHAQKIKPDHDAKTKQFFKLFSEAFAIYSDLAKTKQDIVELQMGFPGLFGVNLDFMRGEDVRRMFNDGVAAGYVSSIPAPLRG